MSITNCSILSGATVSATGGTAINFQPDGLDVANGIHVSDIAGVDFRTRKGITFKARQPRAQTDGSYSKGKHSATLAVPRVNANGVVEYPLIRIECEYSAENSTAEIDQMLVLGAQLCTDPDFATFWRTGSKA